MTDSADRIRQLVALRKGARPGSLSSEELDHLFAMILTLASENAVLTARLTRIEKRMAGVLGIDRAALCEAGQDADEDREIEEQIEAMIERLFHTVTQEVERAAKGG